MSANEMRKAVKAKYETILGRNIYSQDSNKRNYVFKQYKDGKYYSDCSSSYLNTLYECGVIKSPLGNTASIHYNGEAVNCEIKNGIPDESKLRVGDALLFRGNDPSRPLQIGHIEMYVGNNTIYGHGSNTPSAKNLVTYCKSRESQKAKNGLSKGLVEVVRYIPDEVEEVPVTATLEVLADLNYRSEPNTNSKILGQFKKGDTVVATKKCDKWFYIVDKGWCSSNYLQGFVMEDNKKVWYMKQGYKWDTNTVITVDGYNYAVDKNGWIVTPSRMEANGAFQ